MKKVLFFSFRSIFLLIVALSLLPALGIIIWTGVEHGRSLETAVRNEAFRQIETLSLVQNTITESVRQTLTTLAGLPAFKEAISVTNTNGVVTASSRLQGGVDLSGRKHVREALSGKGFVAGEYVIAYVDEEPSFPFSITLRNREGNVSGALSAVYKLSAYKKVFDALELPDQTILGITDHEGNRVFFHPSKETNPVGKPVKESVWQAMKDGSESGTLYDTGSDNISRFYAYRKMRLPGGAEPYLYLVLGIPETTASAPARAILLRNIALMGLAAAIAIIISAFIGYAAIGSRLSLISRTVKSIKSGDLSSRTGISYAPLEVYQAAVAVDEMAEALEMRNIERSQHEKALTAALEERETLLKEVHHRVKNNMQLVLSIINLEKENCRDLNDFSVQVENRIRAMASVHELMYQSDSLSEIEMDGFLHQLLALSSSFYPDIAIKLHSDSWALKLERAVILALIINELITNCAKYGKGEEERVQAEILFSVEDEYLCLIVSDHGNGFPAAFNPSEGTTLGLVLVQSLTAQLGGTIIFSNDVSGSRVELRFPKGTE